MQYIKKFTDNLTYTAYVNSDNSVSPNVFMYFDGNNKIMKYRRHHKVSYNNVPLIVGPEI